MVFPLTMVGLACFVVNFDYFIIKSMFELYV